MASFDENGKYIKTNWKAGDKITATKLNKIEESIEAVNDNDISRHVEADARLDALEAKDVAHDKEFTNVKNLIEDAKDSAELGDYEINSRMQFLEDDVEQAVNDMNNAVTTIRNEMNAHTNTINTNVDNKISAFETEFDAEVAGLKAVDEAIQNDVSEIQNDMTNAKMQSATVTDAYKFTVDDDEMVPSLVTLNNIEGLSSVETNDRSKKYLVSTNVGTICTIDINGKNYAEDIVCIEASFGSECIIDGTNITVRRNTPYTDNITSYAFGSMSIPTLEDGKKYCVFCDDVEISNGGASAIETQCGHRTFRFGDNWNSLFLDTRTFNDIFVYDSKSFIMRLHCTIGSTVGEVTYKNLQIYEVKEMIVPDVQLNSLPNGVKDEIKDGMLIKRTNHVNLAELTWVPSVTNSQFPQSDFVVYYTRSAPDFIIETPTLENELGHILCNNIPCVSNNGTASAEPSAAENNRIGISGHREWSEIRIKVPRYNVPDLESLYAWLASDNVHAVYQLETPEYIPFGLTIKADKGDTVVINTTKTMDLTYDIQLNTRAQIDALQESVNHTRSEYIPLSGGNVTGSINPAIDNLYDLGSTTNKWRHIYSHSIQSDAFEMYIEDNEYTSQLHCSRGNFRLTDGYNSSIFSWSHDYHIIGPDTTNEINLGSANYRFKSLYLNAQPNVSSDRTLKENIKYVNSDKSNVSYEDMYAFVKDDLELATYNLVEHDKLNMGFIAQDLLANLDGTDNKVGQMIVNPVPVPTEEEIEEGTPYPTLSYDMGMYTSVLAGALKEAINKIEQLEARINELENK